MTKYLLFSGDYYYPTGGMRDCQGVFDDLESAQSFFDEHCQDDNWAHVAAIEGNRHWIVSRCERGWVGPDEEWRTRWVNEEAQHDS